MEFSSFFFSSVSLFISDVTLFSVADLFRFSKVEDRFARALFSGLFILLILLANWANASATALEAPTGVVLDGVETS